MSDPTPTTCPRCGGKGYTMRGIADLMRCHACNGTGRVPPAPTPNVAAIKALAAVDTITAGMSPKPDSRDYLREARDGGMYDQPPAPTAEPTPEPELASPEERVAVLMLKARDAGERTADIGGRLATRIAAAIRDASAAACARGRAEGLREAEQMLRKESAMRGTSVEQHAMCLRLAAAVAALAVPPERNTDHS